MLPRIAWLVVAAIVLAGCADGADEDGDEPDVVPGWAATGILYRDPTTDRLAAVDAIAPRFDLHAGGFDWVDGLLAQGDNDQGIRLQGIERRVVATDVHQVARASLDPTGAFAVVQATAAPVAPGTPMPPDLNIYRIDLADGSAERIGTFPEPDEGAEWSADGTRIAYSSFSPVHGIDLHVVDAGTLQEVAVFEDAGGLHLSFSKDGKKILEAGRLRVLDTTTGAILADLRDEARAGVVAAGYELEDRFPGQANRGTFPLDGDFSPDGTKLVFDGAVKQGSGSAVVIATMALDGTGFTIAAGPFAVDPDDTNGLNYSETNPMWA